MCIFKYLASLGAAIIPTLTLKYIKSIIKPRKKLLLLYMFWDSQPIFMYYHKQLIADLVEINIYEGEHITVSLYFIVLL